MQYTFEGPKITEAQLTRLEACLTSNPLPADLSCFLLAHNGGTPSPAHFDWVHPQHGPRTSQLYNLLGLDPRPMDDPQRDVDMIRITLLFRDDLPRFSVVIGFADRDDLLLTFVCGPRLGEVWIKAWDEVSLLVESPSPPESCVYRVAESFTAFVSALHQG